MKTYSGIIKLIFLIILLPIVAWQLGFKKTYELHRRCLEQQIIVDHSLMGRPNIETPQPISGDALLSNGKILFLLSDSLSAHHVEVVNYTPRKIDSEKCHLLYNGELLLSGKYINLVEVIQVIERLKLPLKIRWAEFSYDKSRKEVSKVVLLHLLLQQIEQQAEKTEH